MLVVQPFSSVMEAKEPYREEVKSSKEKCPIKVKYISPGRAGWMCWLGREPTLSD